MPIKRKINLFIIPQKNAWWVLHITGIKLPVNSKSHPTKKKNNLSTGTKNKQSIDPIRFPVNNKQTEKKWHAI